MEIASISLLLCVAPENYAYQKSFQGVAAVSLLGIVNVLDGEIDAQTVGGDCKLFCREAKGLRGGVNGLSIKGMLRSP
jgi:hypothetical protein